MPLAAVARFVSSSLSITAPLVPTSWVKLHRPVFLIGCSPKSTARIAEVLACHADVAPWRVPRPHRVGRPAESGESFGQSELSAAGLERLRLALRVFSLTLFRRQVLVSAAGSFSPIDRLDRTFPDCRVVHVVRDARPEILGKVLSERRRGKQTATRDQKEAEREVAIVVAHAQLWAEIAGRIQDQGTSLLGPDRYAEIRVEEFRAHPDYQLSRLDAFCGLDPSRRDRKASARLLPDGDDGWNDGLSPEAAEQIRAVAGARMTRLGYRID
jgi:hypothetical protein